MHLSDAHLFADAGRRLKGVCTLESYRAVIELAHRRMPDPDLVILGGDMAQDESAGAYLHAARELALWDAPAMISPGNHADLATLSETLVPALAEGGGYSSDFEAGAWRIITLTTHLPGSVPGYLSEAELHRLQSLLDEEQHRHVLIALHHPPLSVGSRWMDEIGLLNRDALWHLVEALPRVRGLLCGHIHQAFDVVHGGVRVLGTPATSVQFKPLEDDFALDALSPGYRWLELHADGTIESGIERIEGMMPPDLENSDPY